MKKIITRKDWLYAFIFPVLLRGCALATSSLQRSPLVSRKLTTVQCLHSLLGNSQGGAVLEELKILVFHLTDSSGKYLEKRHRKESQIRPPLTINLLSDGGKEFVS